MDKRKSSSCVIISFSDAIAYWHWKISGGCNTCANAAESEIVIEWRWDPKLNFKKKLKIMSFHCQKGVRDGPTWQTVAYVDFMSSLIHSGTYLF